MLESGRQVKYTFNYSVIFPHCNIHCEPKVVFLTALVAFDMYFINAELQCRASSRNFSQLQVNLLH